jgi:hypothetical protein
MEKFDMFTFQNFSGTKKTSKCSGTLLKNPRKKNLKQFWNNLENLPEHF